MNRGIGIVLLLSSAFFETLILAKALRAYARKYDLLDRPVARSSHSEMTPRGVGLSFVIAWTLFMIGGFAGGFLSLQLLLALLPGAALVAGIGFIDDHYHLSPKIRFPVHLLGALMLVIALKDIQSLPIGPWEMKWWPFGALLAAFCAVWSINLFNFMDGIDTLASAEAICIFSVGGIFFWLAGGKAEALSLWILVASITGFMAWNLPPARVFMGDTGSYFLGFLIAAYAFFGAMKYQIPIVLWLILYGIFWFDATATLARRVFRREKWYQAHRCHAYQRLHQAGWSHGRVSAGVACINLILIILALAGYFYHSLIFVAFLAAVFLLAAAYGWVEYHCSRKCADAAFWDLRTEQK